MSLPPVFDLPRPLAFPSESQLVVLIEQLAIQHSAQTILGDSRRNRGFVKYPRECGNYKDSLKNRVVDRTIMMCDNRYVTCELNGK